VPRVPREFTIPFPYTAPMSAFRIDNYALLPKSPELRNRLQAGANILTLHCLQLSWRTKTLPNPRLKAPNRISLEYASLHLMVPH
jgi:hypothetical protein